MKKIALLGATGQTGTAFLNVALARGYAVKALVRSPQKMAITHPQLEVLQGDVLQPSDVQRLVEGCDVVVSLFGHVKGSPSTLQTDGTKHILAAMQRGRVPKIVSLSGGGLPYPEQDRPKFADHLIRNVLKLVAPTMLRDAIAHHQVLKDSAVAWVIARAPRLTNGPRKGAYRVGWVGVNASTSIGRADLADFLLQQVEDTQYHFQMPFVSY